MSHPYNYKFDQMRNNAPDGEGGSESIINHASPSNDRKVCFVQLDGSKLSLNYSFLLTCEYYPEQSMISLDFTTHTVTVYGLLLEKVFEELETNMPKKIICKDARYNSINEAGKPVVNKIEVLSKT